MTDTEGHYGFCEERLVRGRLVDYASRPEFCYFHCWRKNDLVMWDDRVLLHRAIEYDFSRYRRVLRRTTIGGNTTIIGPFFPEARAAHASG